MTPTRRPRPLFLLLLALLPVGAHAQAVPDWENPAVFERGQEKPHSTLMPFADAGAALYGERKASPWCLLLSGSWKFHWAPVPGEARGAAISAWRQGVIPRVAR